MSCYQRNFNMDLRSRPWTEEEEKRLIEEANKIKDCVGYYNWRKVSAFVDNRSPYECMLRFTQVDPNHRHGKFTPEEDAKLLAGVEMFGLRWKAIARFIGTRNSVQVRDRYLECLNPENNYLAFTYDEDLKLLKQHKKFGPCWAQICQFFQGRSASRLGSRFRQLQRWKKKKAWFESQPVEVKRMLLGKALPLNERREMETKIRDYFTEQLGINLNDYKRQILDRNNGVDPDVIPPRPPFVLKANGALEKEWSTRWALKISSHERLRKSLQRILTEDAKRRAKAKSVGKLPRVVEEENEEELYKQAVTEALKEQSAVASTKPQKNKLKKMEGLLAKAFHEGSAIHVSKILEALNDPKEAGNSRGKLRKKHRSIDMALKNFFQADNKEKYRPGRIRKFFEKDMRSDEIVQAEKAELEVLVPAMCLKSLGTSLPQLYGSARRHHVLLQEQLLNFPSHSDDPEFLAQNARLDQQLEECALEETSGGQKDDVAREKLIKKKRRLDTIFINRYLMEQKKLKTATFSLQEDIALFHRLLGETGEVAGLAQGLPAVWLPKTKAVAAGDQESKVKEMHSSPVDISAPSVSPAKLAELGLESAAVSSETILKLTLGELSDLKSETSDLKRPASEVEPQAEIKEEGIECADSNQLILLSESQIEEEKQRLEPTNYYVPPSEECALTLPCIPPNVTTLTLLKSLLLKRGELMRQSALLTKIGNVLSKSDSEPIVESSERKLTDDNNEAGEKIVIVDSEGQEINMEEFAEFIEEETQPVDDRKKVLSKEGNRLNKGKGSSPFVNQNKNADFVLKHMKQSDAHVKSRDKIRTIDLISSNPEYNVANFSLRESVKRSEDSETNWKLWEKGKGQGKTGTEYQRQKFKSNYEVVVVPTSNRAPPPVQKKAKKEFLPPKSFARVGKTYSCVQKSDRGGSIDSSQGNGNTKIDLCQAQLKDNASQSASNSSQPLSSNTALGSSSDGFEFPYLVNTGKEVIEIDQDDSEPEPEGEDTNLSDSYTERVSGAFEERAAASDGKYQNLLSGVQIPKRRFSDKNVVVVDIAPESGNIVHYKQDSKGGGTFRACELKPSINAEGGTNICISGGDEIVELGNDDTSIERTVTIDVRETLGSMEILRKEKQLVKKFKAIDFVKESPAYKTLEARMRALFLWPVLMSTVRHIQNPRLMEGVQRDVSFDPPNPRYKKRGRPTLLRNKRKKMTKAMTNEKHKKSERYRRSQFMQQKRQEWREARDGDTATQAPIEDKCAGDARVGTVSTGASEMPPSEAVSLEDVTLAFPDRNDGCGVGDKAAVQENGAHSSGQAGSGTAQEQPKKRGRGRQKGCRYKKKIYPPAIERPKRNTSKRRQPEEEVSPRPRKARKAKETSPPLKTPMDLREHTRAIPQWWKDAMLAAMMAKQTLAREGEGEGPEVRVEDDEDFIDQGNYSDDEWVQDWRRDQSRGTEANNVDGQENK
ncbi:bromodomain-containing protein 2 [Plakobranchus ocellatus]|uniref:Bromodomain-containing protein 2 n=1 Tax=Plakobranchus ocellatus TaxID=259542 RepID=A0AAV3YL35_9GAST|nr:bromodomain-containing protein 2 [Plakobranchus ocellatus]